MSRFAKLSLGYACCDGWGCVACHGLKESSAGIYSLHTLGVLCGACEAELEEGIPAPPAPPAPEAKGAAIVLDSPGLGLVRFYGDKAEDHALAFLGRRDGYEVEELPIDRDYERLLMVLYPLCEHGMSADLCADPITHYPRDM